jgi:Protein of unknown function (DUF3106)
MRRAAVQREPDRRGRALPAPGGGCSVLRSICLAALLACAAQGEAQVVRVPTASMPAAAPREEGVRWQSLTAAQREVLAPLERDWPGIDAPRKQKWLALAGRFKTLSPEERSRITARMSEWTQLTPAERGQARMNFEEARQVPATDRSARWQAYQALPPEEREQFAARAASAASGTRESSSARSAKSRDSKEGKFNVVPNPALTQPPKQVAPTLVQAAPGATTTLITRRPTPPAHQQTGMPKIAATPEFVNRSTLLPKRGPQAAAVAPASAVAIPIAPRPPAAALAKPAASAVAGAASR